MEISELKITHFNKYVGCSHICIEDLNLQGYDAVWIAKCCRHCVSDVGEMIFTEILHSQFIVLHACYERITVII